MLFASMGKPSIIESMCLLKISCMEPNPNNPLVQQNLPRGEVDEVNSCDSLSNFIDQQPEFASSLVMT